MTATNLITPPDTALTQFNPVAGALRVHATEKAEQVAIRAKDPEAIEKAGLAKLEAQRDFAADYRARFPAAGRCSPTTERTPENYCASFGFHVRTVQRWAEKLLEPASFNVARHEIMLKVWRLLQMEQAANYSSESVEWHTPAEYIEVARLVMGGIDLDPASRQKPGRSGFSFAACMGRNG